MPFRRSRKSQKSPVKYGEPLKVAASILKSHISDVNFWIKTTNMSFFEHVELTKTKATLEELCVRYETLIAERVEANKEATEAYKEDFLSSRSEQAHKVSQKLLRKEIEYNFDTITIGFKIDNHGKKYRRDCKAAFRALQDELHFERNLTATQGTTSDDSH